MKNGGKTFSKLFRKAYVLLTVFAVIFLSFGPALVPLSKAATTGVVVSTLGLPNQKPDTPIKASSSAMPIAKIAIATDATQTLTSVQVNFSGTGFATSDLAALAVDATSGVALYNDAGGSNTGTFGTGDVLIPLTSPVWSGSNVILTPASAVSLPSGSNIYYVVIKTSSSAVSGHQIIATVPLNGVITNDVNGPAAPFVANSYLVDTVAPTLNTGSSGPATGATNFPISGFIHMAFNENLDQSTLNPSNITLTAGGSPVAISTKPYPNGFDVIVSNKPTYAAGSRFAKASTVATGFFNMFGTGTINPQGSYSAPTNGDIVYFQHETFPAEVGIVTNNTLTSGTFAINNFMLFGGQQITKFATPAVTGLISGGASVTAGDILVANATVNPTDVRYNWHIVTTSGTINSVARLDGNAGQPGFTTGSSFSKITPVATVADNGATADGILAVSQGELVYAKLAGGSYGWHLVTTAGNMSSDATEGTAVVDSLTDAAASLVAASSQMSKIASAAQGPVTDTTTNFNFGDMVMAKATANSGNNGSYAFHLVSRGATDGAASDNLRFDNAFSPLAISTAYVLTMGTGVKDYAGNAFAGTTIGFTTGATGSTNTTPPFVQTTTPMPGNQSFPTGVPLKVQFSVPMNVTGGASGVNSVTNPSNVGIFADNYGASGVAVSGVTSVYDDATRTVTLTPSPALSPNTHYILKVSPNVQSSTGASMPQQFSVYFTTGAGSDSTPPTVMGVYPGNNSTGVARNASIAIGFSEDMNPATISASNITVTGGVASGSVSYSPSKKTAYFTPSQSFVASTAYTVTVTTGVTDLAGTPLGSQYTSTFTTGDVAISAATVTSANADNFGVAITFSQPMKSGGGPNAADNIANYSLESSVGSSISLGGKSVFYDGPTMTAKISGLSLQNGNSYKVTVSNLVQDVSDLGISTAGTPAGNIAQGTVANAAMTGGQLGPGSGPAQTGAQMGMTPINVMPMNRAAGATSNYGVEFPVTTSVPSGGSIVLTFPAGFDVTNAVAATAGTESFRNNDINGPMAGAVTIASVTKNVSARTITITTGGAATGANSFISFDLKSIINSTIPSSSGYSVDIKTKGTDGTILDTKTSNSFFLGQTGSNALTVNVFNDNGAGSGGVAGNNIKDGTEAGIVGAMVFLSSPATGGQNQLTNGSGVATFASLAAGDYMIGIDPKSVVAAGYSFNSAPQQLAISGNTTKNFGIKAAPYTISGTVTGPANTLIDIFASSPNGFSKVMKDTGAGGSVAYSLPAQANTAYRVGVGPAIPDNMTSSQPIFTFMPPSNIEVAITTASVVGKDFTLSSASKTIAGTVKDSAGNGINGVMVFARPAANSTTGGSDIGMGTGGQTDASGNFTLKVVPGVYMVGAFKSGMPNLSDRQITVPVSGASIPTSLDFVLDFNSSSALTISGTVKDDSGNAIPYAGVSGRKVVSTGNTTPLGGGGDNFVGGPTDSNGVYTLYVTAGTWVIESFAPGFGKLGTKTITVGTSSMSGQDFSAQTLSMGTISGQALKASVAQQGVMVRVEGANGGNSTVTDVAGNYSIKVPAGTYNVTCMFPGVGESAPLVGVVVTADTTTADQNFTLAAPITITVNLTAGAGHPITDAFVDVRDANGRGNSTNMSVVSGNNAVYTVNVPSPGTYTVRSGHPAYGMVGTTASVSSTQTITYTAAVGQAYAVTGSVTGDGSALSGTWVSLNGTPTGQTNIINIGGQTDASGNFSINVPNGTYRARADKPGFKSPAAGVVIVNGATISAGTIALVTASRTITGTVTLSGNGVSNAFVDANDGQGGFAVAQTDSSGNYSLAVSNGTWNLYAHSMGYEGGPLAVTVNNNSPSGQAITLSAISGFTIKPEKQETMTPTSGGFLTNNDIGSNFKVNIPANALGTSSNASTITTQTNTSVPNSSSGTVLVNSAVKISAVDSSGQPIKTLNNDVTITIPYDALDLPEGGLESSLVVGVWNEAAQNYDTLSTTVDTTAKTLTATTSHFSDFAPLLLSSASAPATPVGLAATAASASQINLTWTQTSGATSYDIYRSTSIGGTYARLGSEPTVSSGTTVTYADTTGLSASTAYYYKISAISAYGESASSSAVSATTSAASSGGNGGSPAPTDTTPPTNTSIIINSAATTVATASVTLTLAATGATQMMISNDAGFAGSSWETYAVSKTWTLTSGDGTKTVYAKFKDAAGNISSAVNDTITLSALVILPPIINPIINPIVGPAVPASPSAVTLYRILGDPRVYVIKDGTKKWISTPEVFEQLGYKWTEIKIVTQTELNNIPDYEDNLIRQIGGYKVYLVVNGVKHHIPNPQIFLDYGFLWKDVKDVEKAIIDKYSDAYLLKESGKGSIYYARADGVRRLIPTDQIFKSYGDKYEDVQVISAVEMRSYPLSNLIRLDGSNDIYLTEGNIKRRIPSPQVFKKYHFDWSYVMGVNETEFNFYQDGAVLK